MSLFKKKDEDRKKAYKPTGDAKEKAGASGKGGGEPAKPKHDPKSKGFADIIEKRNNDGNFGYGYVDENTGIEVPWYIDMINGGGANAAGDTFVSPFAELPFEGGMLSAPSKIGNAMNIAPYGFNQPRKYAQAGMVGYPELPAVAAPTGSGVGGGSTSSPNLMKIPNSMTDDDMGLPSLPVPTPDPYGVGKLGEMTMPNYTPSVGIPRVEMNTMSDLGSGAAPTSPRTIGNFPEGSDKTVSGSSLVPPAIFSAGVPNMGGTYTPPPSNAGLGLGKGMFITDYVASKGLPVTQENIMALMDEYMALGYGAN